MATEAGVLFPSCFTLAASAAPIWLDLVAPLIHDLITSDDELLLNLGEAVDSAIAIAEVPAPAASLGMLITSFMLLDLSVLPVSLFIVAGAHVFMTSLGLF